MIENKHFHENPNWESLEEMCLDLDGIPLQLIEAVAKLGGSVGVFNQSRLEWLDNCWVNYQKLQNVE